MRHRTAKSKAIGLGVIIIGLVFLFIVAGTYNALDEAKLLWLVPVLLVIGLGLLIWYRKIVKQQEAQRIELAKQQEAQRIEEITAHQADWGKIICEHLVADSSTIDERVEGIMSHLDEWGEETCLNLLRNQLGVGMTSEMVRLSLGKPTTVDNKDVTETVKKYRWIYGVPRHGAAYIWFQDDRVTRIKQ